MDNDAVAAVAELLGDLAEGRVYGGKLKGDQTPHMPRRAIVVRGAGGAGTLGGGYMAEVDDRVDVRCYGADAWDAHQLAGAASRRLHRARDVRTANGRIIWARRSGGISDVTETDTSWPLTLTTWQVLGDWLAG